jgi:hypothetical protein
MTTRSNAESPCATGACGCPSCAAPEGTFCHCGVPAEWRSPFNGVDWCMPCKFGAHPTCECSEAQP